MRKPQLFIESLDDSLKLLGVIPATPQEKAAISVTPVGRPVIPLDESLSLLFGQPLPAQTPPSRALAESVLAEGGCAKKEGDEGGDGEEMDPWTDEGEYDEATNDPLFDVYLQVLEDAGLTEDEIDRMIDITAERPQEIERAFEEALEDLLEDVAAAGTSTPAALTEGRRRLKAMINGKVVRLQKSSAAAKRAAKAYYKANKSKIARKRKMRMKKPAVMRQMAKNIQKALRAGTRKESVEIMDAVLGTTPLAEAGAAPHAAKLTALLKTAAGNMTNFSSAPPPKIQTVTAVPAGFPSPEGVQAGDSLLTFVADADETEDTVNAAIFDAWQAFNGGKIKVGKGFRHLYAWKISGNQMRAVFNLSAISREKKEAVDAAVAALALAEAGSPQVAALAKALTAQLTKAAAKISNSASAAKPAIKQVTSVPSGFPSPESPQSGDVLLTFSAPADDVEPEEATAAVFDAWYAFNGGKQMVGKGFRDLYAWKVQGANVVAVFNLSAIARRRGGKGEAVDTSPTLQRLEAFRASATNALARNREEATRGFQTVAEICMLLGSNFAEAATQQPAFGDMATNLATIGKAAAQLATNPAAIPYTEAKERYTAYVAAAAEAAKVWERHVARGN